MFQLAAERDQLHLKCQHLQSLLQESQMAVVNQSREIGVLQHALSQQQTAKDEVVDKDMGGVADVLLSHDKAVGQLLQTISSLRLQVQLLKEQQQQKTQDDKEKRVDVESREGMHRKPLSEEAAKWLSNDVPTGITASNNPTPTQLPNTSRVLFDSSIGHIEQPSVSMIGSLLDDHDELDDDDLQLETTTQLIQMPQTPSPIAIFKSASKELVVSTVAHPEKSTAGLNAPPLLPEWTDMTRSSTPIRVHNKSPGETVVTDGTRTSVTATPATAIYNTRTPKQERDETTHQTPPSASHSRTRTLSVGKSIPRPEPYSLMAPPPRMSPRPTSSTPLRSLSWTSPGGNRASSAQKNPVMRTTRSVGNLYTPNAATQGTTTSPNIAAQPAASSSGNQESPSKSVVIRERDLLELELLDRYRQLRATEEHFQQELALRDAELALLLDHREKAR
jgi:hypothetical protein